jgi:LysM repeat protein
LRRSGALALIGLVIILVIAGIVLIVGAVTEKGPFTPRTPTATGTATPPPTFTPLPTATETPIPSPTPLPPVAYTVVGGDTCIKIALKFNVSYQSIIELNKLDANCAVLTIGQVIQVPQPTPTPTPLPTTTNSPILAPTAALITYTVHSGDTCLGIASVYHITVNDLMVANGLTDCNNIQTDQVLIIPLELAVTPGPTPTATQPPPYTAPNQLLPNDGAGFTTADTTITLQWTSVGELRAGEFYQVVLEDVTCNCAAIYQWQTTETKWIVPVDVRPKDSSVHTFRWHVTTVRQRDTGGGTPAYDSAGAASPERVFAWIGGATTPAP